MFTINDILFFDTETTGTVDKGLNWWENYDQYPHVVSLAWKFKDKEEHHIILPEGWRIPDEATAIHGITTEFAMENGEPFAVVADLFIEDCLEASLLCGHNIHFDTSVIKANIMRELGQTYYDTNDVEQALFKGKRIDTMRSSMKWVDARTQEGRLKFPKLEELHSRCFPGSSFNAHNALEDVKAVVRCLPVLLEKGLVELKVKEYPDEKPADTEAKKEKAQNAQNCPTIEDKSSDDTTTERVEKKPQNEKSEKISTLLNQNDF